MATYILRARAYAQQAGDEPAKMAFRLDGTTVEEVEVKAIEGETGVYEVRVPVKKGTRKIALAFTNDFYDEKNKDRDHRDRNLLIEAIEVQGPVGQAVARAETKEWNPARIDSKAARPYNTTASLIHSNGELPVTHRLSGRGGVCLAGQGVRPARRRRPAKDGVPARRQGGRRLRRGGRTTSDEAQRLRSPRVGEPGEHRFAVAFTNDHAEYRRGQARTRGHSARSQPCRHGNGRRGPRDRRAPMRSRNRTVASSSGNPDDPKRPEAGRGMRP